MNPHGEFVESDSKSKTIKRGESKSGFVRSRLGDGEKSNKGKENKSVGEMMNVHTSDYDECVRKKSGKDSGGGKGGKKTNKNQERNFFSGFGT